MYTNQYFRVKDSQFLQKYKLTVLYAETSFIDQLIYRSNLKMLSSIAKILMLRFWAVAIIFTSSVMNSINQRWLLKNYQALQRKKQSVISSARFAGLISWLLYMDNQADLMNR